MKLLEMKGGRIDEIRAKYGQHWVARLVHFGAWEYEGKIRGILVTVRAYCSGSDEDNSFTIWQVIKENGASAGSGSTPLAAIDHAAN